MSEVWTIKHIKPGKIKPDAIRLEILNELRKEGRFQVRELKKTIRTWTGAKPRFEFLIGLTGEDMSVATGPAGSERGAWKWRWLDAGTRIRWAVMSRDWISKTRVGWFGSGPGRGRAVIRGRGAMMRLGIPPRPGIKARNWSKDLQKRRKGPFTKNIFKAIKRGSEKLWGPSTVS